MIFFCPNCWKELPGEQQLCAYCGKAITSWEEKTFTDKLLQALSHPEPMTQMRAVYLVGEVRTIGAVTALGQLFRRSNDPFLQAEVVEALGKIGGDPALSLLCKALEHPSFIVRGEAVKSLVKFSGNGIVKPSLERSVEDPSSYVREIGRKLNSKHSVK